MDESSFNCLIATLRYLATGRNYEDLKFSCAISPQFLGKIIPETCWAIYRALKEEYMTVSKFYFILINVTKVYKYQSIN